METCPTIWTYDWVPEGPRGFVRDLRLRWAAEEAGLAYAIRTVPFRGREPNHLDAQPFGQVPFLEDGEVRLFESGACLLHLAHELAGELKAELNRHLAEFGLLVTRCNLHLTAA